MSHRTVLGIVEPLVEPRLIIRTTCVRLLRVRQRRSEEGEAFLPTSSVRSFPALVPEMPDFSDAVDGPGSLDSFYSSRRAASSDDDSRMNDSATLIPLPDGSYVDPEKDNHKFSLGSEEFTQDRPPQPLRRRGSGESSLSPLDDKNGSGDFTPQRPRQRSNTMDASEQDDGGGLERHKLTSSEIELSRSDSHSECPSSIHSSPSRVKSAIYQRLLQTKRQRPGFSTYPHPPERPLIAHCRTTFRLSAKVQTLLEATAELVNCHSLSTARSLYQSTMDSLGHTIQEMQQEQSQRQSPRDLAYLGILMGLSRTKLALLYATADDTVQALSFITGALHVHQQQPALRKHRHRRRKYQRGSTGEEKEALSSLSPLSLQAGCLRLVMERLERAQRALEQHLELLEKIESTTLSCEGDSIASTDDPSVLSSTKEIVWDMICNSIELQGEESTLGLLRGEDEDILELLSVHASEQDKHELGMKFLRDALQIHLVALGLKHPKAGECILRISDMYAGGQGNDRSNEHKVLGYFHQTAAALQQSRLGPHERGAILNDIAVIHMRRGEYDPAIKFLLDALHTYDEDAVEVEKAGRAVAAVHVWRNLGECYLHMRKFRSAEGAFLKAMDLQDQARKIQEAAESLDLDVVGIDESLQNLLTDTSIADTICRIGRARSGGGDPSKALDLYKKAMGLLHESSYENDFLTDSQLLAKRDQLTKVLSLIARACTALGDPQKGFTMFRLSMKLRNSNGAQKQDKRKSTLEHNMMCYLGMGELYTRLNEYDNAIKTYEDALDYAEATNLKSTLVSEAEESLGASRRNLELAPDRRSEVAQLERRADEEIENGTLDKATGTLKQLLLIRRSTLKSMKSKGLDTTDQIHALGCLLQTFGYVFAKNGDDENAEIAFKDASRLFRKGGIAENVHQGNLLSL